MQLKYRILFIFFFWAVLIYPQDSSKIMQNKTSGDAGLNYLTGVNSDNLGLRVSSTYYLGEMKSEEAVIPLMNILKSDTSASARIMAALSLYKIGDARGIFAIKQAIQFDPNEQVKKMCSILSQMHLENEKAK